MTETSYAPIPAGWYPDPRGTNQRRWWDGTSWTHALEAAPEPVAVAAPVPVRAPEPMAPEPTAPATPGYANLPGPQFNRAPSPSAPTVRRALDPESHAPVAERHTPAAAPEKALPTRRQLRDAAAVLEAQRQLTEPTPPSPVYAMGPAASTTQQPQAGQQPQASFSVEQFSNLVTPPSEQYTKQPTALTKSPAISTAAALSAGPVNATHTFVPDSAARESALLESAVPVSAVPVSAVPLSAVPVTAVPVNVVPVSAVPLIAAPINPSASLSVGPAYQPFGMSPKITTGTMEAPTSVNTSSVWLITVLPALAIGIAVALIHFAPEFYTPFTQGALVFVFAIAAVALAVRDRRQLTLRSHQSTASPAWILLSPLAYLIARATTTKRQAGRGWMPAVIFLLLTAATTALVYFSGLPREMFFVV